MSPLETAVRIVVDLLVRGEYDVVEALTKGRRLSAADVEQAVVDYGRTLVHPPDHFSQLLDIVPIDEAEGVAYSVVVPLWTQEEGRSDLSLELTMHEFEPGLFMTEIDGLHVP